MPTCDQSIAYEEQASIAICAYEKYGKGSGHPAGLNYGDTFACALGKECGERRLFKGEDFVLTDIPPAHLAGRAAPA
jgi:ribonuclease VapC